MLAELVLDETRKREVPFGYASREIGTVDIALVCDSLTIMVTAPAPTPHAITSDERVVSTKTLTNITEMIATTTPVSFDFKSSKSRTASHAGYRIYSPRPGTGRLCSFINSEETNSKETNSHQPIYPMPGM